MWNCRFERTQLRSALITSDIILSSHPCNDPLAVPARDDWYQFPFHSDLTATILDDYTLCINLSLDANQKKSTEENQKADSRDAIQLCDITSARIIPHYISLLIFTRNEWYSLPFLFFLSLLLAFLIFSDWGVI